MGSSTIALQPTFTSANMSVFLSSAVMLAYTYLIIEFTYRYLYDRPTKQITSFASRSRRSRKIDEEKAEEAQKDQMLPSLGADANRRSEVKNLEWMLAGLGGTIFFVFVRFVLFIVPLGSNLSSDID